VAARVPSWGCAGPRAGPLLAFGWLGYTRLRVPWPTVTGRVALAADRFAGWCPV